MSSWVNGTRSGFETEKRAVRQTNQKFIIHTGIISFYPFFPLVA
jgi:hypothetical protein